MKHFKYALLALLFVHLVQSRPNTNDVDILFGSGGFEDLIPEDQFQTFENLEPKELLTLSEASDRFLAVAQHIFANKYSEYTVEISDALPTEEEVFIDRRGVILIDDPEVASAMLERFGHLMHKLTIRYSAENLNEIINSISLHCADTLVQLEVDSYYVDFFDKIEKPFKSVQILSLVGHFNDVASSSLSFIELFPALRDLSLNYVEIANPNSILVEIPTLRHITINANQFDTPNHMTEQQFQALLRKNTHVRSVKLDNGTRDLLKIVNEILPNVESLQLTNHHPSVNLDEDDFIVFENVKNFTISNSVESAPPNVDFTNLVEFHSVDCTQYSNEWINLVQKSQHLEKLYVGSTSVYNEQIDKLAVISSNLAEIFLETQAIIKDETIVKLVRNSHNLKKMFMTFYVDNGYSYELVAKLLQNEFSNQFKVNDCEYELILERIN